MLKRRINPEVYVRAYLKKIEPVKQSVNWAQSLAWHGVQMVNRIKCGKSEDYKTARSIYENVDLIMTAIGCLTPKELEQTFPIEKKYDGERWGEKDYFYTKNILSGLPQGVAVIESVNMADLLCDYMNWDLRIFLIKYEGLQSKYKLMKELRYPPVIRGRKESKRPEWLRVIKGGLNE